jgi:hypothetical protein
MLTSCGNDNPGGLRPGTLIQVTNSKFDKKDGPFSWLGSETGAMLYKPGQPPIAKIHCLSKRSILILAEQNIRNPEIKSLAREIGAKVIRYSATVGRGIIIGENNCYCVTETVFDIPEMIWVSDPQFASYDPRAYEINNKQPARITQWITMFDGFGKRIWTVRLDDFDGITPGVELVKNNKNKTIAKNIFRLHRLGSRDSLIIDSSGKKREAMPEYESSNRYADRFTQYLAQFSLSSTGVPANK